MIMPFEDNAPGFCQMPEERYSFHRSWGLPATDSDTNAIGGMSNQLTGMPLSCPIGTG